MRGAYFGSLDRAFEGFTYVGNAGSKYMSEASGSGGRRCVASAVFSPTGSHQTIFPSFPSLFRPSLGKGKGGGHHGHH